MLVILKQNEGYSMTKVKIDCTKLLGFRLASNETNADQDVKLGAKVGLKPATSPSKS